MARKLRIEYEGAWYHVMNRGINRQYIFQNNNQRQYFLNILSRITKEFGIQIHAYCIMGNHYHFIIRTPLGNLSKAMHYLGFHYASYFNRQAERSGPVFDKRYLGILMNDEEYLLRATRYIHKNPTAAYIVSNLKNYYWSSYPSYISGSSKPSWLFKNEVLTRFNNIDYAGDFRQFTERENDENLTNFLSNVKTHTILYDEKDLDKLLEHINKDKKPGEYVQKSDLKKLLKPPDFKVIIEEASKYFNLKKEDISSSSSKINLNLPRNVTIILAREVAQLGYKAIGMALGNRQATAVCNSYSRYKNDPQAAKHANEIKNILKEKGI